VQTFGNKINMWQAPRYLLIQKLYEHSKDWGHKHECATHRTKIFT